MTCVPTIQRPTSEVKCKVASHTVILVYTNWDKAYSIDFVLAIEIDGFPKKSKNGIRNSWLPTKCVETVCRTYHVVAKTHPSSESRNGPVQHNYISVFETVKIVKAQSSLLYD